MNRHACLLAAALAASCVFAAPAPAGAVPHASANAAEDVYVRVPRIIVPVFRDGMVTKHQLFILVIELSDPAARAHVEQLLPRLTDRFLVDLNRLAMRRGASDEGIDVMLAKRRLLAASTRLVGPGAIRDVLIERTSIRRLR